MFNTKKKIKQKKSPIKDNPLRYPGQSLDEEIQRRLENDALPYLLISVFSIVIAGMEWWRWYKEIPYSPVLYTIFAILIVLYSAYKLFKIIKSTKRLILGRDGEKVVGQYLDTLREKGCKVFHDIVGAGFNIDHVILSKHGIFALETKTYSKPVKGKAIINYLGDKITINGYEPERDPIIQAKAISTEIKEILKSSTGKDYSIRPVVLFPGWYIEPKNANSNKDVWVLNPKALPAFIENQPIKLTQEDVKLAEYHMSRHIRTTKK